MKNMDNGLKLDARKIGEKGQLAKRLDIVRLRQNYHYTDTQIAAILGVSRKHVSNIIKLYEGGGIEALQLKRRGRTHGAKRVLTPVQEDEIKSNILNQTPEDFGIPFCLWTREAIQELVKQSLGKDLPLSTLNDYLLRWELSPQRPTKNARLQDPEKIERWLNYDYPEICKRANDEKAEVLFGDETHIQNTTGYLRGYAAAGHPPVVRVNVKKIKINLMAAISRRGKMRFMLYTDNMNARRFITFLNRLVIDRVKRDDSYKKVFLIVDNCKVHHAKIVQEWLGKHKDKIELFFLPPYAPEYNPDEYLNSHIKRNVGKSYPQTEEQLKETTYRHLRRLGKDVDKIISFFHPKNAVYAS